MRSAVLRHDAVQDPALAQRIALRVASTAGPLAEGDRLIRDWAEGIGAVNARSRVTMHSGAAKGFSKLRGYDTIL